MRKWLDNGYLKKAKPTKRDIEAKLCVAQRDMNDATNTGISDDTRYRLAYEAMLVVAQAMLLADGYRPASQGSHYYSIESLEHTMGESRAKIDLLHSFSKKKHMCQYDQEGIISPEEVNAMLKEAQRLFRMGIAVLSAKHPEYLQ